MYKILLADNEGIVLESLRNMIYNKYAEECDIRFATSAHYTRTLARKFLPDIAIINIEMPGMHGFDVIKEIRSFHLKCVFITVSTYDRASYRAQTGALGILAHLSKPLFRSKVLPVLEEARQIVSDSQKRREKNTHIQEKFDAAVPILEHGFIGQLFFDNTDGRTLARYQELLGFPQGYARVIRLSFGELPDDFPDPSVTAFFPENVFQNLVGSSVRMQKNYGRLRTLIKDAFPLAMVGPIMSNHVFFLLPYWKPQETPKEKRDLDASLSELLETLNRSFETVGFVADIGDIIELIRIHLPERR